MGSSTFELECGHTTRPQAENTLTWCSTCGGFVVVRDQASWPSGPLEPRSSTVPRNSAGRVPAC